MIDARGYVCPMPVMLVKKAVEDGAPDALEVLADDRCAVENITRFGRNNGYTVIVERRDDDFLLRLTK